MLSKGWSFVFQTFFENFLFGWCFFIFYYFVVLYHVLIQINAVFCWIQSEQSVVKLEMKLAIVLLAIVYFITTFDGKHIFTHIGIHVFRDIWYFSFFFFFLSLLISFSCMFIKNVIGMLPSYYYFLQC